MGGGLFIRVMPVELVRSVALKELKTILSEVFDSGLVFVGELAGELLVSKGVLHLEDEALETVLGIDLLSKLVVLILVLLGVLHHLLDFFLGETTLVVRDGDLLRLSGSLVLGGDVENTVGIDIEGDLDLWGSTGRWGNAFEVECTEQVVILGHLSLTFEYLNQDTWLVISVCGESLLLLGWNGSVSWDENGHDLSGSLDTPGESGNIEKKEVLNLLASFSGENSGLNDGSVGDSLIWVD